MLLRASGEREGTSYDLSAVTQRGVASGEESGVASGVTHELWLRKLTELAISRNWSELSAVLRQAGEVMGWQQAVDALVVASAFNGITRVADATGIPLDENTAAVTVEMRAAVGLDAFAYAEKSRRFDQ